MSIDVVIKREGLPDTTVQIPPNAVVGHVIEQTSDKKPSPVKVSATDKSNGDVILIEGDSVREVEFLDEPTPVYVKLGKGVTGKQAKNILIVIVLK